jgi:transglutaminase-like putative cysteine protease
MQIRVGYELVYRVPQPTPMILTLSVHYSRVSDLTRPDHMIVQPSVPISGYRDLFGNWCSRIVAPQGQIRLTTDTVVNDSGAPDVVNLGARQRQVQELPEESLLFLLGSRYCESDLLSEAAWSLFGHVPAGWARVQAVSDYVHSHIKFGYEHADSTKTAYQVWKEPRGVCRDFAHLPPRYCTGYLGDIGVPPADAPMDFSGWFEAFLGDAWYTFDPRNNTPRIGRVLIARGRDAADVAISTTFGLNTLESFKVWTDEVRQS